jgi:taurine dioxygenase
LSTLLAAAREDALPQLTIRKLHPVIGAEITGINLADPFDDATRAALSQALSEHLALVFPGQDLTPDQYLHAASAFGGVMRQQYSEAHMPGYSTISLVRYPVGKPVSEHWHTDHINLEHPPLATMLYGIDVPSAGGGTSVASMRAAYAALAADEQERLAGLSTVNTIEPDASTATAEDLETYGKPIVHPLVRTHPAHGTRALFFHTTKVQYIEGMSPDLTHGFLDDLLGRIIRPEITYYHRWTRGDVLIIDDRATLHRAHGDFDRSEDRLLWRILVEGDKPRLM